MNISNPASSIVFFILMMCSPILVAGVYGEPRTSGNPILPDYHADPSAHEWDGRYWIYPTHDIEGSTGWFPIDWHVFSSTDLVDWKDHGVIFSLEDISWANRKAYAPDCMKRHGKYYFYFPADYQMGVAVSDNPDGPFKDALGEPLITRKETGAKTIDPAIFIDDDGQAYLYYGGDNDLRVVKLKEDMITRDGPIITLEAKHFHEGPWMHKRDGVYYLSYCSHDSPDGVLMSRLEYSTAPTPLGPFTHRGVIMDNSSRNNHHSIVKFADHWYIFYHVMGPSWFERKVCAEYLCYNDKGLIKPVELTEKGISLKGPCPDHEAGK
jgi:beta-xylosidase